MICNELLWVRVFHEQNNFSILIYPSAHGLHRSHTMYTTVVPYLYINFTRYSYSAVSLHIKSIYFSLLLNKNRTETVVVSTLFLSTSLFFRSFKLSAATERSKHFAVSASKNIIKHINYECLMFLFFCAPLRTSTAAA